MMHRRGAAIERGIDACRRREPSRLSVRRWAPCLLALLAPALLAGEADPPSPSVGDELAEIPGIEDAALRADVYRLASDEFEGRRVGTPGLERAAAYLQERLRALGVQPAGEEGGYRQRFEITVGTELGERNEMRLLGADGTPRDLVLGKDFLPLSFSDDAIVESAELVFAGYGIQAPDLGYDDYAGLDVGGKVVIVLRDEPQEDLEDSVFAGDRPSQYSDMRFKAMTARDLGVAGMIFVTGPQGREEEVNDLIPLRNDFSGTNHGLPAVVVRLDSIEPLLREAAIDLEAWQLGVDHTMDPHGVALPGARVHLRTELRKTVADTWNVLGMIPGSDPQLAREVVVVGAHFDHLGLGGPGSLAPERYGEVHNGADDNASGTAGLLAVAGALKRRPTALRRSVVIAAFSGEEEGLLGSSHYVRQPVVPLERTVFMLNMDMIGRLEDDELVVSGIGTGVGLEEIVVAQATRLGLEISRDPSGFGASDQTVFYSREIPVLFLFTGAHSEYHKPEDDADRIDYPGLRRIATLAYRLVEILADADAPPAYRKVSTDKPVAGGSGRGYGPFFGSIPDFGESPAPGVLLSGVREGSPAEKAGVRAGDLLVGFGGVTVENLYDFTYALRKHRPGDEVEVVVVRDGERITLTATLEKRGDE